MISDYKEPMTDTTTQLIQNLLGNDFTINAVAKVKTKVKRVDVEVFVRSCPRGQKDLVKKLKKKISEDEVTV